MIFSKASGVNDSMFGKSQEPIRLMMEKNLEAFEASSALSKIFTEDKTKNFAEKYTSMTSLENFEQVEEGGAYPIKDIQGGFEKVLIRPYRFVRISSLLLSVWLRTVS